MCGPGGKIGFAGSSFLNSGVIMHVRCVFREKLERFINFKLCRVSWP